MTDDGRTASLRSARRLLHEHFGEEVASIQPLAGGLFSHAFAFDAAGREYVLRINADVHALGSFQKDDYAGKHFGSAALPIPRIVAIGSSDDGYYAISERAPGRLVRELSAAERRALVPAVLDTLEVVGCVDVSGSRGYGDWGDDGNGRFESWHGFLATVIENDTEGYYRDWHRLYHEGFLERDFYETVYRRMMEFAASCPEARALIHNDLHFDNLLSDGELITGVVDWANALYGDPLYDVAWANWQSAHPGWWYEDGAALLEQRFGALPSYSTRVACYQCHIGLDHLRFYAKNGRRADYQFCRDWLLSIVSA